MYEKVGGSKRLDFGAGCQESASAIPEENMRIEQATKVPPWL